MKVGTNCPHPECRSWIENAVEEDGPTAKIICPHCKQFFIVSITLTNKGREEKERLNKLLGKETE